MNLHAPFYSQEFERRLAQIGVRLVTHFQEDATSWHDFSTTDLYLAVRDLTEKDASGKPATKLINAWLAGVPALLGPEPAFRHLRRSDLDYIEIKTPEEAITAILRLQENPELYRQMVVNALRRAKDFTVERYVERWVEVLGGPVAEQYARWRKQSAMRRAVSFALRVPLSRLNKAQYAHDVRHGYRPISGRFT